MDTPSRRVTRSQMSTLNPSSAGKPQVRALRSAKKKELPRTPFTDLTNDSPIAGLIPSKLVGSAGVAYESTPRSKLRPAERPIGEDLLRMQVTNLLKKVEADALVHQNAKAPPGTKNLFESPMRLAAPTPANTPASSGITAAQETKAVILPPIVIASPVCPLDASSKLERISPTFVSTAELLSSMEEPSAVVEEQPITRTLKFDSPERQAPEVEGESATEVPTPASVSTAEILSSIEEHETQFGNRALIFDSPQKTVPDAENFSELFSPSAHPHPRTPVADEEDTWSVSVNINSPEKEVAEDLHLVDVPTTNEVDSRTMEFVQSVLVDPEIKPRAEFPALWERRDIHARSGGPKDDTDDKDDDDYEDCEEYEDEGEETYADGTEAFDEVCEELCKGISTINMGSEVSSKGLPVFQGKHTRFIYHSDDDEMEEEIVSADTLYSPSRTKLKGLPTPKGKHIRFDEEDSDLEKC